MKKNVLGSSLILPILLILNACAAAPTVIPTGTSTLVPAQAPSPTREALRFTPTPVESAFAPGPTAAPLDDIIRTHTVTFDTPDGAKIKGELYGSGKTAVVFSVMGNCKQGWREFSQLTAAQGLMALTYLWRDCGESGPISDARLIQNFVNDARGAIDFVRSQGAEEIILAGASLGGLASAKLAIESRARGIVVFASPLEIPRWDFKIETAELDTDIPKLFLTAEDDRVVPLEEARALYDLAAEPREWQAYPGSEHGTDLFDTEIGEEIQMRILEFIVEVASRK